MDESRLIRESIRDYNADIRLRIGAALGMGLLSVGVAFLCIWMITYLFFWKAWISWTACGVFLLIASLAAWRGHDPAKYQPMPNMTDVAIRALTYRAGVLVNPVHMAVGLWVLLAHGPACWFDAWALSRTLLPSSERLIGEAQTVMKQAALGVAVTDIRSPIAGVVLARTMLIRPAAGKSDPPMYTLSEKAKDALAPSSGRGR